ncbi:type IV pilin protein [Pistricoccus aurantiacus]|uniref:Type IV pilin protein n=1 Tax=Pistricoccus aurantiacus TaxID=1883414 RepID=A0A5B8SRE6_9GAMM|nr:type IV pilin protein [Pistricoccus aurantiacus]QEA38841.1 type IV pilin protein [Pistricoccus aurantiacus]
MTKRIQGFTLIEMMIVVAIVGILAGIAYPSYQAHVERSRRGDAIAKLLELAQAQERFMARCGHYATQIGGKAVCDDSDEGLGMKMQSQEKFYQLSLVSSGATSYTLKATPQGAQSGDTDCTELTLNHLGERGAKNSDSSSDKDSTLACW